jgi:outer membrane lipoprotein SlyB
MLSIFLKKIKKLSLSNFSEQNKKCKRHKMKTIIKEIFLIALFAVSSMAQTDSVIYLKETDFSLYKMQKVKYESTGVIKDEKQLIEIEDVSYLTFLSNDSLALINETTNPVYTRLADINEVSKYKYRFNPVLGTVIGAVGGGLIGGIIGIVVSGNDSKSSGSLFDPMVGAISNVAAKTTGAFIGALIGAVGGGIIGLVITNAINHATIELFSVPDNDKKAKLIKFLRKNK